MKSIIIALLTLGLFAGSGCNKKSDSVSQLETVSFPTINFPGGQYFSINTGGTIPQISVSAYDSVIGESYDAEVVGADEVDNMTPGLYVVSATAKNKFGFVGSASVYIAVTDVSPSIDLSGTYERAATGGIANVTKKANGLYVTDNVGGVARASNPGLLFPVAFVHIDDTTISIAPQPTPAGTLASADEKLTMAASDTTFSYRLAQGGSAFGTTAIRTFVKQ